MRRARCQLQISDSSDEATGVYLEGAVYLWGQFACTRPSVIKMPENLLLNNFAKSTCAQLNYSHELMIADAAKRFFVVLTCKQPVKVVLFSSRFTSVRRRPKRLILVFWISV
jgi:hypothetical protein